MKFVLRCVQNESINDHHDFTGSNYYFQRFSWIASRWIDIRTDGQTDGLTDKQMDRPFYRDMKTNAKLRVRVRYLVENAVIYMQGFEKIGENLKQNSNLEGRKAEDVHYTSCPRRHVLFVFDPPGRVSIFSWPCQSIPKAATRIW